MIATAIALFVGELVGSRTLNVRETTRSRALLIGLAQIFAILPGISRSGVTIVAGLAAGMTREAAAKFSMLIATPAIAGAGLLVALDAASGDEKSDLGAAVLGAVISAVTAYFVIAGLMRLLRSGSFRPFIVYCGVVGVTVVIARAVV